MSRLAAPPLLSTRASRCARAGGRAPLRRVGPASILALASGLVFARAPLGHAAEGEPAAPAAVAAGAATAEANVAASEPFRFLEPLNASGEISIGGRMTWGDDRAGKFREYRDFSNGILGQFDLLVEDDAGERYLRARGSNIGYDDQRYALESGRYGRYRFDVFFAELPHVFSSSASTLFQRPTGNQLRLPAGVQTRIAGATPAAAQLETELSSARPIDLGFRQVEGGTGIDYRLSESLRVFSRYRLRDRRGTRPLAIQYGSPGGRFDVFASPVDDDTHQVDAGLEYTAGPLVLGLDYSSSFYRNEFLSASVDNPLVALDAPNSAARGRISLDPDNSAHNVSTFGSLVLPLSFPARITGSLAYGLRLQDDDFLPHTINGAIASPTVGASGLDGMVHTVNGQLVATARPLAALNLKARYRINRFDDETDPLRFTAWVRNDDALRSDAVRSVRNDYTRQDAEVSGDYRITRTLKARLGYELEAWDRSDDRQVRSLVEHGPMAELAWQVDPRAALRVRYAFEDREGDGYQSLAFLRSKLGAADFAAVRASGVHELRSLRRFDQADRRQHRVDFGADLAPGERTDLALNLGWRESDYHDSSHGLTKDWSFSVGVDASRQLHARAKLGAWYTYEQARADQGLRWRPRTFAPPITIVDDPRNDWRGRDTSRFHSLGTTLDLVVIADRLDLVLGYELHLGEEEIRDRAAPGFVGTGGVGVGADGGAAFTFPNVAESLQVFTGEARLQLSEHLTLRAQYRYEDFEIRDFRTDDLGPYRGGNDVYLGNVVEDYEAHVLVVGASVRF